MKTIDRKYIEWMAAGAGTVAIFLFFRWVLPYHLFHREQTMLFLFTPDVLAGYLKQSAALSRLLGDFLTQLFYYEGVGPLILAFVLLLWGLVVFRLLVVYIGRWAWIPAVLVVVWEGGRQCGLDYPLSGTLALTGIGGILLLCRWCLRRSWKWGLPLGAFLLVVGYWLFGYGHWSGKYGNMPDLEREYHLALDAEMYFGRWEKVQRLLERQQYRSPFVSYYANLLNARQNNLPDKLVGSYRAALHELFLPVAPGSSYRTIYAANEVWFALGDMTMAEHACILGMIFSPRHTGARALKRLAEINLINGDEAAAMKYLRMLQKTLCYRNWAERRMPAGRTPEVSRWLEGKRALLPVTDTLRSSANVRLSLRHLLRNHPENRLACDYLLCFDLLGKNIAAFADDYREFAPKAVPPRLYAEVLLVCWAGKFVSPDEMEQWSIPLPVAADFREYTRLYESGGGKSEALREKYGKTYWYYFHFTETDKKEND